MRAVNIFFALVAAVIFQSAGQTEPTSGSRLLVVADGLPRPLLQRVELRGESRKGAVPFKIVAIKTDRGVSISGEAGKGDLPPVDLENGKYPLLDLYTIDLGENNKGFLVVEARFGKSQRNCYLNDDGRSSLRINYLENGRYTVRVKSRSGCSVSSPKQPTGTK